MLFYFLEGLTILTAFLAFIYVMMIASFCYGWLKTSETKHVVANPISVAVIISARNEEKTISSCLSAILNQTYPSEYIEIIVVDDSSEDDTAGIARAFSSRHKRIRLIQLSEFNLIGKKNAITKAISQSYAELIVTTDADCIMGNRWLENLVAFYQHSNAKMIVGPVAFKSENSFFEKMQSLELVALIASTAGSLFYGKAIMCNGANLAYSKKIFEEVNGFEGIDKTPTGDDVLLMYKIKEKYSDGIEFLKNNEALVYTEAKTDLSSFLAQRKRWASKGFASLNRETKAVALIVYFTNFLLLIFGLIAGFASLKSGVYLPFFKICLILAGFKCFIDFLLLFLSASFFDKKHLLLYFLPEQFIYMLYVVVVGIVGNKGKYVWKGRKIN